MTGNYDPVGQGFVASLARPGGNITGLSFQGTELPGKRLEILKETVPQSTRIAVLANPGLARLYAAPAQPHRGRRGAEAVAARRGGAPC